MIKFFRRIRQDLLLKGKSGKYLKYATGEIILVVIGILIALGINNWNENRKTEERVKQFLISLKSDLSNDLREINIVTESQTERHEQLTEVIEISRSTTNLNDSTAYFYPGRNFTFFPTVGSYSAANNAGLIDYIQNEELKRNILNLYEHFYPRIVYNGKILDDRTGEVEWEGRNYWDQLDKRSVFSKEAILDEDFNSQMGYLNRFIRIYLIRCNDTKSAMKDVIQNIDNYLN